MIPIGDDVPSARTPIATYVLLGLIGAAWVLLQGAGFDAARLIASVCNLGLVPGEITHLAPVGTAVEVAPDALCVVDADRINYLTPLSSMFLHGSWAHLLGNAIFLWVFGRHVEDRMSTLRFAALYLLCGLAAAAAQVAIAPSSPVPIVGASGAISAVMGAYLVIHPRARVRMFFVFIIFFRVIALPAWIVLLYWFGLQVLVALPQLVGAQRAVTSGVAVVAHVGGFIAGAFLAYAMHPPHRSVTTISR